MTFVLDTSAVLALLLDEDGASFVADRLDAADMSIVNYAEVLAKTAERDGDIAVVERVVVQQYGIRLRAFREAHAIEAARLRPLTRHLGLSFGDRACLAQGILSDRPILSGDRDWAKLDLGLDIRLIR